MFMSYARRLAMTGSGPRLRLADRLRGWHEVPSREQMDDVIRRESCRADRNGHEFCLVLFDLGSRARSTLSCYRLVRAALGRARSTDVVGWFAEGTLCAVLPDTPPDGASVFAKGVCALVAGRMPRPRAVIYRYPGDQRPAPSPEPQPLPSRRLLDRMGLGDVRPADPGHGNGNGHGHAPAPANGHKTNGNGHPRPNGHRHDCDGNGNGNGNGNDTDNTNGNGNGHGKARASANGHGRSDGNGHWKPESAFSRAAVLAAAPDVAIGAAGPALLACDDEDPVPVALSIPEITARAMTALMVRPVPWWKRGLDIAGAAVALVLLAPLMAAAALAVMLSSPGPILFTQRRAGLGGRPFTIFKFRTMRTDAETLKASLRALSEVDGPAFKLTDDPRVTRVGRFLRSTSIDELPQLWNVLRGEMSLVGPRPLPLDESDGCTRWQRHRLDVTPGLTCIWQVSGRSTVSFAQWVRMDMKYIRRRTLLHDLWILVRTVPAVVLRKGAW
jgi:lipopolysaccharide/colanic/teichoic acid biosynthesis glycosyltransferase